MHLAAELAKIDVVEMLLKTGLDLTIQDRVRVFNSVALKKEYTIYFECLQYELICFLVACGVAGEDSAGCGSQGR